MKSILLLVFIFLFSVSVFFNAAEAARLTPSDLVYKGAFLTPTSSQFENIGDGMSTYAGASMSWVPTGDGGNGSLYLSFGGFVAELRPSTPKMTSLDTATVLSTTSNIASGSLSGDAGNDSTGGIAYVPARGNQTQPRIYWGTYEYYNTAIRDYNSLGMSAVNLSNPQAKGVWHIGPKTSTASSWSMGVKHGEYIFPVPQSWADTYTNGRSIFVGRTRESAGAGGSAGPVLTAIAPINDVSPPAGGAELTATPLMSFDTGVAVPGSGTGWQKWRMGGDPDWDYYSVKDRVRDGAWVEFGDKRTVVLAMTHGTFDNLDPCTDAKGGIGYNGGFCARPSGDTPPWCYGTGEVCALADPYGGASGFHAGPYPGRLVFVDIDDLESVALGQLSYDAVDGYGVYNLMDDWGTPAGTSLDRYGSHDPCGIAFDESTGTLFVCQANGNDPNGHPNPAWPVIHVYEISGEPAADKTPPVRSNGAPSGSLATGTTQTTMSLTTNENATCKWSTSSQAYASMPYTFAATGGTSHSTTLTGLTNGSNYTHYVRCIDGAGNANTDNMTISFSVALESSGDNQVFVSNLSELYAAFANEQDGAEIVIAPGTYTLTTTALSIDANNVTVRGATGNRNDVVIRGDSMSSGANIKSIFYFPQGPYGQNSEIKDLSIGRVGWHPIFFNGAGSGNGTKIDNVRIFDSWEQMVKATVVSGVGTINVIIKNSLFEYTAGTGPQYYIGGIDAHSPNGWVIQANEFRNIKSPSGSVAEHAVHLWSNSSFSGSNTIERNKIVNCDRGIGIWNGTGINTIRNNMIMHDGSGAFADVGIDIQNTPNTRVYNNTVWIAPSGYYAAIEFRGSSTIGSYIVNNLTNKQIAQFNGAIGTKSHNVENAQASWFVNVGSNLHLVFAVSGVSGSGIAVSGLVDDFDGDVRTGSIDIGADQRSSMIAPPPLLRIN